MDNDLALERERHQMEEIRELDYEELLVEEVDGNESSDDDDANDRYRGTSVSAEFAFDPCLASLHTYLGEVEDTRSRMAFLDGGALLNLPLFYLEGVVLFPEATLPLRVIQPNFVAALQRALKQADAPYTLGVVRAYRDTDNGILRFATTGTTAEIRQLRRLDDGSLNVLTRGQQRFRLRRRWIDVEGAPCGEIQIIQEDSPLRTPRDAVGRLSTVRNLHTNRGFGARRRVRGNEGGDSDTMSEESFSSELPSSERRLSESALASSYCSSDTNDASTSGEDENFGSESDHQSVGSHLANYTGSIHSDDSNKGVNACLETGKEVASDRKIHRNVGCGKHSVSRLREAPSAFWPSWVYRMYDSYHLAQQVADMWNKIVKAPNMDGLVRKPDLLSFHIASKMPVSESTRQELLEIDGVSYRLRREIELLESFDRVRCKTCQTVIARRSDMLVMSSDGPLGAYVNPHGFVHELMTLLAANDLILVGHPVKKYSWFPGYAWTITYCSTCETQMGWLFTATSKALKPRSFWGIRTSQVADDMS